MAASPSAARKPAPPAIATAHDNHEENEMEQELRDHAVLAYNQFVRAFHRTATQRIAANRVSIDLHLKQRERVRRSYPTALSAATLDAWQNIERGQTSEPPATTPSRVRKTARSDVRTTNASWSVTRQAVVLPHIPPMPTATMWTALSKNFDVEDEPELKHKPYFGDDDEEDVVSEYYQLNRLQGTSTSEVDFTKQLCEAVLQQLQATWELDPADLKLVAKTIQVEENVVVEMHKMLKNSPKSAGKRAKQKHTRETESSASSGSSGSASTNAINTCSAATPGTPGTPSTGQQSGERLFQRYEAAMDSFRRIFCRRCFVYDCDYHALDPNDAPPLQVTESNAIHELRKTTRGGGAVGGMARNCGNQCFLGQTGSSARLSKSRLLSSAMGWGESERVACVRAYLVCSGSFCDMAKLLGPSKTCVEVAEYCEFNEINDKALALERKSHSHARRPSKKSKKNKYRPSISHLQHIESKDRDIIQTTIVPCAHLGPCDEAAKCACIEHKRLCSKLCKCIHDECKIFFSGCRCKAGRCRTKACPCVANGRECDLDLCTVCCDDQRQKLLATVDSGGALDESPGCDGVPPGAPGGTATGVTGAAATATDAKSDKSDSTSCQNRNMGMRKHKHVRMGRSTMENGGWGLFVDEFVAKDEFIIEYLGEMVTHEEAERRGLVYDKKKLSYLFNLDSHTVVDATRKGNKMRFMNHSDTPNCKVRILNINDDFRIGIYANRDIAPHTELFFNYGYEKDVEHEYVHKQPTITTWMKKH